MPIRDRGNVLPGKFPLIEVAGGTARRATRQPEDEVFNAYPANVFLPDKHSLGSMRKIPAPSIRRAGKENEVTIGVLDDKGFGAPGLSL